MRFLEQIAGYFHNRDKSAIGELCFIFPNRRSGLFFRKYLSDRVEKPLFSPAIFTVKDMVTTLSGKREADRIELLFDLYDIYSRVIENPESFDDFIYWGEIILNDFNETDKYLADAKKLFSNVKDLKDIDSDYSFLTQKQLKAVKTFWEGFLPEGESSNKRNFRLTWEILSPLYEGFRERLLNKGAGYEGLLYREVALNSHLLEPLREYKKVIFVGFNALNECEKRIFKGIQKMGIADFYWDYDSQLLRDAGNRASYFMNFNLTNFPSLHDIDITSKSQPQIEIIGVASSVVQTKIAGEILKEIEGTTDNAVILPDESLLMPMLNSVPPNIELINITMGYPLNGTPLFSLIKLITEMEWGPRGLYYKKVLPLLKHSYVKSVAGAEAREILNRIVKESTIYIPLSFFDESSFLKQLFSQIPAGESAPAMLCKKIIEILDTLSHSPGVNRIEREFIFHIQTAIIRVEGILMPMSVKTLGRILSILTEGLTIPFRGEPLSGLQIMGALETRALDFDNIIICSVNEGLFPKKSISNSFIPYNLKLGFGLPVKEHEDALYSYLFYRLISRAKNVYLLYDTRTEGLKNGEASRFIMQLKYLYNLPVKERSVTYRVEPEVRKDIIIDKDESVMERMGQLFLNDTGKALSASALNTYIDCPLKFYFSYIQGVEVQDEISEEIEADQFGSIFHSVMEQIYKPYEGKSITADIIKSLLSSEDKIEKFTDNGFLKYKNISEPKGYALLIKKLIIKYVQITLRYDLSLVPFEFIGAEKRVTGMVNISPGMDIPLKGFIDRVDKTGTVRIIDYKSGKGDLRYRDIESLFDSSLRKRNNVAFQMHLYDLLLNYEGEITVEPYFIRELATGKSHSLVIYQQLRELFQDRVIQLVKEVFNPEIPFSPATNRDICKWCDFSSICY
jgi:CRISPR/Cas system-associated exonuclease Cas4 (RecB family)